jgi:hypothetical protein
MIYRELDHTCAGVDACNDVMHAGFGGFMKLLIASTGLNGLGNFIKRKLSH